MEAQLSKLKDVIEVSSVEMLSSFSRVSSFEASPMQGQDPVLAYWMSLVLISCRSVRITFAAHFDTNVARLLASPVLKISPDQIGRHQTGDFFKEFCNLTGGKIKRAIEANQLPVGLSLPLLLRGFDHLHFDRPDQRSLFEHRFWVKGKNELSQVRLGLTASIHILDEKSFKDLRFDSTSGESEITFL